MTAFKVLSSAALRSAATKWLGSRTGEVSRSLGGKLGDFRTPKDYGAVGDGVTDDHDAFSAFFADGGGFIPPGTYLWGSRMIWQWSNVAVWAKKGTVTITSSASYDMVRINKAISDVLIEGVKFSSTYVNAAADASQGVIWSNFVTVTRFTLRDCEITNPSSGTDAVKFVLSSNSGPGTANLDATTHASISDVTVDRCYIHDVGQIGVEVVNNKTGGADLYTNVSVTDCHFKATGAVVTNGQPVSLSGPGTGGETSGNLFEDIAGVGLENVGCNYHTFRGNRFKSCTRATSIIGFSAGPSSLWPMVGLTVEDNKCLDQCTGNVSFILCQSSRFAGNDYNLTGYVIFKDCTDNECGDERYTAAGTYGLYLEQNSTNECSRNRWSGGSINGTAVANGTDLVHLVANTDATLMTNNSWNHVKLKKANGGAYWGLSTSAIVGNFMERCPLDEDYRAMGYFIISPSDANYTVVEYHAQCENLRVNATWTTGRQFLLPKGVKRAWRIKNQTGQTMTVLIAGASGSSITIASTTSKSVCTDGTNMFDFET